MVQPFLSSSPPRIITNPHDSPCVVSNPIFYRIPVLRCLLPVLSFLFSSLLLFPLNRNGAWWAERTQDFRLRRARLRARMERTASPGAPGSPSFLSTCHSHTHFQRSGRVRQPNAFRWRVCSTRCAVGKLCAAPPPNRKVHLSVRTGTASVAERAPRASFPCKRLKPRRTGAGASSILHSVRAPQQKKMQHCSKSGPQSRRVGQSKRVPEQKYKK